MRDYSVNLNVTQVDGRIVVEAKAEVDCSRAAGFDAEMEAADDALFAIYQMVGDMIARRQFRLEDGPKHLHTKKEDEPCP